MRWHNFFHKNNTFIQVFSSTSTYGAFIFSLDTKHKFGVGWGGGVTATFAVRTGLEEKYFSHKQLWQKESHIKCQQYYWIQNYWPALTSEMKWWCCFWKKNKTTTTIKTTKNLTNKFKTTDMENITTWNVGLKSNAY